MILSTGSRIHPLYVYWRVYLNECCIRDTLNHFLFPPGTDWSTDRICLCISRRFFFFFFRFVDGFVWFYCTCANRRRKRWSFSLTRNPHENIKAKCFWSRASSCGANFRDSLIFRCEFFFSFLISFDVFKGPFQPNNLYAQPKKCFKSVQPVFVTIFNANVVTNEITLEGIFSYEMSSLQHRLEAINGLNVMIDLRVRPIWPKRLYVNEWIKLQILHAIERSKEWSQRRWVNWKRREKKLILLTDRITSTISEMH